MLRVEHFIPWLYTAPTGRRGRRPQQEPLPDMFSLDELSELEDELDEVDFSFREHLQAVEYISAMRLAPERTYHQTGETRAHIGAAGENWTGILVLDSARPEGQSRAIGPRVASWLQAAGLAADVKLEWLSDRHYEVQIQHPVSREYANLADVGQANSQILPVLVGGFRLSRGSTYMVEEPEIHLHPRAQAQLGEFFLELYERGVASIVETHSEYLVLRLQQLVASDQLPAGDIAFYYVYADTDSGEKRLLPLELDERARFSDGLPGGFFPERLSEARKLAQLRAAVAE